MFRPQNILKIRISVRGEKWPYDNYSLEIPRQNITPLLQFNSNQEPEVTVRTGWKDLASYQWKELHLTSIYFNDFKALVLAYMEAVMKTLLASFLFSSSAMASFSCLLKFHGGIRTVSTISTSTNMMMMTKYGHTQAVKCCLF